MNVSDSKPLFSPEEALGVMDLIDMTLMAHGIEDLADRMLSGVSRIMQTCTAFLYIVDSSLSAPRFFQRGFRAETISEIEKLCADRFNRISSGNDLQVIPVSDFTPGETTDNIVVYPLQTENKRIGLIGLTTHKGTAGSELLEKLLCLLTHTISLFAERLKSERQISNLNKYLTVSSMIAQSLDLHELLDITLQCCIEAVSAEAASILLLDEEKKNFFFYNIEGPAKPVLLTASFPADKGIAGAIMETGKSEIINDVYNDPRFYVEIDSESGFQTRNMIAIPLVAGEEKVGVLEVLNKADNTYFTEEEHLLLQLMAEEIAFAIRNARVFEYVINSYCKQRQGQATCKGCRRPLGSWTPCVKYREAHQ